MAGPPRLPCCVDVLLSVVDEEDLVGGESNALLDGLIEPVVWFHISQICCVMHRVEVCLQLQRFPEVTSTMILLHCREVQLYSLPSHASQVSQKRRIK